MSVQPQLLVDAPHSIVEDSDSHNQNNRNKDPVISSTEEEIKVQSTTLEAHKSACSEHYQPGDHVYVWCHAGIYQHHGIVLDVTADGNLLIADFTNLQDKLTNSSHFYDTNDVASYNSKSNNPNIPTTATATTGGTHNSFLSSTTATSTSSNNSAQISSRSSSVLPGGFRLILEDPNHSKWCKVKYQAAPWEVAFWKPGTCSPKKTKPVDQILARVHFLVQHGMDMVPNYHLLWSNCETVAVWCMTGEWQTRQVAGVLPAWLVGFGALVSLPAALVASASGIILNQVFQQQWDRISQQLNQEFDQYWTDDPTEDNIEGHAL